MNNEYKVIFSDEIIRFSASYPPSPESSKKKSSPTAAVIVAFTVFENKKTKNFMKLEYISYTMTLDYKKKLKCNKMADFRKKITILLKILMVFWPGKIIFSIQS